MDVRRTINPPRRLFGRRGFLTGAGATLLYAALAPVALPRFARRAAAWRLPVHAGRRVRRSHRRWRRAVDAPGAAAVRGRRHAAASDRRAMADRGRRADGAHRQARCGARHSRAGPLGPRRSQRAASRRAGTGISSRSATRSARSAARGRRRRPARPSDLRFAFVSCQHYAQGFYYAHKHLAEEDIDFAVHLGDYIYEGRIDQHHRPSAPARRRDHVDRRLPDSLRGLQVGSVSAGGARRVPVDRHLGRSRDRERLRRVHPGESRRPGRQRARLRVAPRARLPGVLRAHAAPRRTAPGRTLAATLSAAAVRRDAVGQHARHAAVPIASRAGVVPDSPSGSTATVRARSIPRGRSRARRSRRG